MPFDVVCRVRMSDGHPSRFDALQAAKRHAPCEVVERDPVSGLGVVVATVDADGVVLVQDPRGGWEPLHPDGVAADPFAGLGGAS